MPDQTTYRSLQGYEDVVTRGAFHESIYLLYSTLHWKPLVNGYAGIEPQPYLELRAAVRRLPSEAALDALRRRDVRFVVVHRKGYGPPSVLASSATSRCSPASCARRSASTATPCTR